MKTGAVKRKCHECRKWFKPFMFGKRWSLLCPDCRKKMIEERRMKIWKRNLKTMKTGNLRKCG